MQRNALDIAEQFQALKNKLHAIFFSLSHSQPLDLTSLTEIKKSLENFLVLDFPVTQLVDLYYSFTKLIKPTSYNKEISEIAALLTRNLLQHQKYKFALLLAEKTYQIHASEYHRHLLITISIQHASNLPPGSFEKPEKHYENALALVNPEIDLPGLTIDIAKCHYGLSICYYNHYKNNRNLDELDHALTEINYALEYDRDNLQHHQLHALINLKLGKQLAASSAHHKPSPKQLSQAHKAFIAAIEAAKQSGDQTVENEAKLYLVRYFVQTECLQTAMQLLMDVYQFILDNTTQEMGEKLHHTFENILLLTDPKERIFSLMKFLKNELDLFTTKPTTGVKRRFLNGEMQSSSQQHDTQPTEFTHYVSNRN